MPPPQINTAIPRQRHQIGGFVVTVLDDIDSSDPNPYRYIMAVVEEGTDSPCLYVTSERNRGGGPDEGFRLRVIQGEQERELTPSDEWGDIDKFALAGLGIVAKLMKLTDEQPVRLI